jgi:hypothetical protein
MIRDKTDAVPLKNVDQDRTMMDSLRITLPSVNLT